MEVIKKNRWLIILGSLFFLLAMIIENINGRFWLNDFKVYYSASSEFVNDGSPYGQAFGLSSGYFKYSPFTLIFFAPYTLFSFETAKFIHYFIISIMGLVGLVLSLKSLEFTSLKNTKTPGWIGIVLLALSAVHLSRELHLGNINLLLIALVAFMMVMIKKQKEISASLAFSLIILIKPYLLILVLPILIKKKWKVILYTPLFTLLLSAIPVFFIGFDGLIQLYLDWFESMVGHGNSMFSHHTINSIVKAYSGIELSSKWTIVFVLITGLSYLGLRMKYFFSKSNSNFLVFDMMVLFALVPNLVITDTQHFLFSVPLIAYLLVTLKEVKSVLLWILFAALIFLYGFNSNDLLGYELSDIFDNYAALGVSNLLLIAMAIILRWKLIKNNELALN